jgi:hypothetical protein
MRKLIAVVVLIIILGGLYAFGLLGFLTPQNEKTFQAVFLSNGQVYFGHIKSLSNWIVLKDVYYLQASTSPLQAEATDATATPPKPNSNIQLVKLGGELHGPEDQMYIERDKVLFWENMKVDSKVMEAIGKNQSSL